MTEQEIAGSNSIEKRGRASDRFPIITIVVALIDRHGRFSAHFKDGRLLVASSRQPFFDGARWFIERGHDPSGPIEMWHVGGANFALRAPLGVAAKLTIEESTHGPKFRAWRIAPPSAVEVPRVRSNDRRATPVADVTNWHRGTGARKF